MSTLQSVETQYVKAGNGVTFAYRRLGQDQGVPLVMQIHFRANMDFWDPLLINSLAAARSVIVFDQAGVGRSTGDVPTTFQGWAKDLVSFVEALGLGLIDLFGFSLGGLSVQAVAVAKPELIRQLVLAGTTAPRPLRQVPLIIWPRELPPPEPIKRLATAVSIEEGKAALTFSFFPDSETGRGDFSQYWKRISERTAESPNLQLLGEPGTKNQRAASINKDQSDHLTWFHELGQLKMPVLIANGDDDTLIPTSRSWELFTQIPNAKLIIYPRAGHGFLWQYAEQFAGDINSFLDHGARTIAHPEL